MSYIYTGSSSVSDPLPIDGGIITTPSLAPSDLQKEFDEAMKSQEPITPEQAREMLKLDKYLGEGRKDDQGKLRMELIPPEAMEALAAILTFGAAKYDARNWEKGMDWSRVYGALQRHLWSWFAKENDGLDPETGKSHLWHALCCVTFLVTYEARGTGTDDRP